jgi:hypothetical protein
MNNFHLDFIMKGHSVFYCKEDFVYIEKTLEDVEWIQDEEKCFRYHLQNDLVDPALEKTQLILGKKYVSSVDKNYKLGYRSLWNGTEISSCSWHNDLMEGPNLFFLMYLTRLEENVGGEIQFRHSATKEITGSILPQKYKIVVGSQELKWEHRVVPFKYDKMERITANFGFYVNYESAY